MGTGERSPRARQMSPLPGGLIEGTRYDKEMDPFLKNSRLYRVAFLVLEMVPLVPCRSYFFYFLFVKLDLFREVVGQIRWLFRFIE